MPGSAGPYELDTARPYAPTVMLFVTPGEGTQNLDTPPGD